MTREEIKEKYGIDIPEELEKRKELGKYFELEAKKWLEQDWIKELDRKMFEDLVNYGCTGVHISLEDIKNNFNGNESERI